MAEDIYMNWATINLTTGANSTTVVEAQLDTGMTPFSNTPWAMEIVRLEFMWPNMASHAASNLGFMCLATRQDETDAPLAGERGVIQRSEMHVQFTTSGIQFEDLPQVFTYLPGILVAAPKLSLYWESTVNGATWQNAWASCRIGFLTVPMNQARWNEVAQTWALGQ